MIANIFHDMLSWEYNSKLWAIDHPWIFLVPAFAALFIYLWCER